MPLVATEDNGQQPDFQGRSPKITVQNRANKGMGWVANQKIDKGEILYWPHNNAERFDFALQTVIEWRPERRRAFFKKSYQVDDEIYNGYHSETELSDDQKLDWNLNHSCEPNCWYFAKDKISAMRDIQPGEEICYDYATTQANEKMNMTCLCNSQACRKTIKGDDWKIPQLQERYKGHFLPYIQRKIDSQINKNN